MDETPVVQRAGLFDKITEAGVQLHKSLSSSWSWRGRGKGREEEKGEGRKRKRKKNEEEKEREAGVGRREDLVSSGWVSCKSLELSSESED